MRDFNEKMYLAGADNFCLFLTMASWIKSMLAPSGNERPGKCQDSHNKPADGEILGLDPLSLKQAFAAPESMTDPDGFESFV